MDLKALKVSSSVIERDCEQVLENLYNSYGSLVDFCFEIYSEGVYPNLTDNERDTLRLKAVKSRNRIGSKIWRITKFPEVYSSASYSEILGVRQEYVTTLDQSELDDY